MKLIDWLLTNEAEFLIACFVVIFGCVLLLAALALFGG